jgi:uncharacterized damage-inducible protein DinB
MSDKGFLPQAIATFSSTKALADRAIAQVHDDDLHRSLGPESNSVAVVMKHIAGNLLSRWTDFLTSDGEKPWRRRDGEFEEGRETRAELVSRWERAWTVLFETLRGLTEADVQRTVRIRTEPQSVTEAILRQIAHYAYHVGQIVLLSRWLAGPSWKTLSIARGESEAYNRRLGMDASAP